MFKSILKFLLSYVIFVNIAITTSHLYLKLYDTSKSDSEVYNIENKYYKNRCSIYCDKHGCNHKHVLQKYHWIFQKYDVPLTTFDKYRDINLLIYLLLIPFIIHLFFYLKK